MTSQTTTIMMSITVSAILEKWQGCIIIIIKLLRETKPTSHYLTVQWKTMKARQRQPTLVVIKARGRCAVERQARLRNPLVPMCGPLQVWPHTATRCSISRLRVRTRARLCQTRGVSCQIRQACITLSRYYLWKMVDTTLIIDKATLDHQP